VQLLAKYYLVICLDLPGHGDSTTLPNYSLDTISHALLDAIPVERFHVLGWSLGGSIAITMAQQCPQRVVGLLLLSVNPKFERSADWPGVPEDVLDKFRQQLLVNAPNTLQRFATLQVHGLPNAKLLLQQLKQGLNTKKVADVEALKAGLVILKQTDLRQTLQQLSCPLIFIVGDKDSLVPFEILPALQSWLPDLQVYCLVEAGHMLFLSHGAELLKLIQANILP
jgi:pimeloyl-[acyl-carrier protein] methyl ester esterase